MIKSHLQAWMLLIYIVIISAVVIGCKPVKTEPIRGVWLTNVASDALYSDAKIEEAVNTCKSLGINTIYVVTWNNAMTTYPSEVMANLTGVRIDPRMKDRDPLKTLITYAHAKDIKVHAWFEFGFSCSYQKPDGGAIIKVKPNWAAKDKDGILVSKNGFQWMNAFDPEVQDFITSLVLEVVKNYDIDGIQGDDRLPACPSSAGYDSLTISKYQAENFGEAPPQNEKDYNWVKWRSQQLTNYLATLYRKVKEVKPNVIVSMAPSIYPWAEEQYLQDWPSWVNLGIVDHIIPQIYRYNHARYAYELEKILHSQINDDNKAKFTPGILLQVDKYNPSPALLDSVIATNRKNNVQGEVYFFYEGIKKFETQFKTYYTK